MENKKIGFIGAGNMAFAISKSINDEINIFDNSKSQYDKFHKNAFKCENLNQLVENSDIIFLSVKPQNFSDLLVDIKQLEYKHKVFVTIAAGITTNFIAEILGDIKIIRVMPNTPLLIGEGATALCRNDLVNDDEFNFICNVFQKSGEVAIIDENKMNEIIAINGSSPAYIYYIADIVAKYGASVGIDENIALKLFAQTLIGSGKMILQSTDSPKVLTEKVCSKGGTTIEAINSFKKDNLEQIFKNAMDKCIKRAYELSK
ncbi:MAG: pyrroline-5-carboxylate reductase [Oscillospiraceae bacterium]